MTENTKNIQKSRVRILDFTEKRSGVTEYVLEDGTTVRLQPRLEQAVILVDDNDTPVLNEMGSPTYNFQFKLEPKVIPKNKIIYIPKMTLHTQHTQPPKGMSS